MRDVTDRTTTRCDVISCKFLQTFAGSVLFYFTRADAYTQRKTTRGAARHRKAMRCIRCELSYRPAAAVADFYVREMCNCFTSFSDPGEGPSGGTRRVGGHNDSCPFNGNTAVLRDIYSSEMHERMRRWIITFVVDITHVSRSTQYHLRSFV